MNVVYKIIVICIFTAMVLIMLKNFSSPYIPILSLGCGLICLTLLIPYIRNVVDFISALNKNIDNIESIVKITIKIAAISIVCEFGGQLCSDSGADYLASKIYFAGKVAIVCLISPQFIKLFEKIIYYVWLI